MRIVLQSKLFYPFAKYFGFQRCLQHDDIRTKRSNDIIKGDNEFFKDKEIQNQDNLNIDNKINSVTGWVPYIKDKTSLIVYNFFSKLLNKKKFYFTNKHYQNHNICFVRYLTLKQNEIIDLSKDFFKDCKIDNGLIVLKLFHPSIPKIAVMGGNLGFGQNILTKIKGIYLLSIVFHWDILDFQKHKFTQRNYFPSNF